MLRNQEIGKGFHRLEGCHLAKSTQKVDPTPVEGNEPSSPQISQHGPLGFSRIQTCRDLWHARTHTSNKIRHQGDTNTTMILHLPSILKHQCLHNSGWGLWVCQEQGWKRGEHQLFLHFLPFHICCHVSCNGAKGDNIGIFGWGKHCKHCWPAVAMVQPWWGTLFGLDDGRWEMVINQWESKTSKTAALAEEQV